MSFDLAQEYKSDPKAETEGVWEHLGGDAEVLVAAWGNPNYEKALLDLPRHIRRRINRGTLSEKEDRELMAGIVSQTVLLDWKNLTNEGKTVKYSSDKAKAMLVKYAKFYRTIVEIASDESLYQGDDGDEEEKNLPKS